MLNIGKYAAVAAAGLGLAALAAPQAEAACFVRAYGCAPAFGMYRPIVHRPVFGFAYRPVHRYAYRPVHAYAWAAPRHRIYRPFAFRIYRPATYAWYAPRVRIFRPYAAYGAAYGYVPRRRPIFAYACGC